MTRRDADHLAAGTEGGVFFVLRRIRDGRYEETARGRHRKALGIYTALAEAHQAEHRRHREVPEPDSFPTRTR
ncbi:hypothetical protein [Nonomuraea insulae]|uniref:Uncharacterized protein n=1 Tax=Nonomuraea insulae TaxID=1616787 RepID=A0ABW1D790_9ACTN